MADLNSFNKVIIAGNVGHKSELRKVIRTQVKYIIISIATNETFFAETKARKYWHDVYCFGNVANYVAQYIKKGDFVIVEGKLRKKIAKYKGREYMKFFIQASNITRINPPREKKEEQEPEEEQEYEEKEEEHEEPF
ncbi:MAG: single-stranded DNA-binding protein [Candidatus Aenigmarchaeota archaeon]|nr:single-stranded DNA-binding protein [Candidatus Aenigmarchaeota archaeon]